MRNDRIAVGDVPPLVLILKGIRLAFGEPWS